MQRNSLKKGLKVEAPRRLNDKTFVHFRIVGLDPCLAQTRDLTRSYMLWVYVFALPSASLTGHKPSLKQFTEALLTRRSHRTEI